MKNYKSILVLPDLHIPFHHPDAFEFLDAVSRKYKPEHHVCLGDEVDQHCMSFHNSIDDLGYSASSELEKSIWYLHDLYALFPKMKVVDSNHGSLLFRKAKANGIPISVFKKWSEILEAPKGWVWSHDYSCKSGGKEIYFHHSLGKSVLRNSKNESVCFVQGHHHGQFDIQYWANPNSLYWGMTAGCLIDKKSIAFEYGKNNLPKPIVGCAMIIDGYPQLLPMKLKKNGRWTRKL